MRDSDAFLIKLVFGWKNTKMEKLIIMNQTIYRKIRLKHLVPDGDISKP
jgi:hypothetical protein